MIKWDITMKMKVMKKKVNQIVKIVKKKTKTKLIRQEIKLIQQIKEELNFQNQKIQWVN